jgi:hypothetical protein
MSEKIVTINFKRYKTFDGFNDGEFIAFKKEIEDKGGSMLFDRRNNIYCAYPTMNYEMYKNYLNFLNESYSSWLHYGYFDMGMVPYLMWPSFMDNSEILEHMRDIARAAGIDLVKVQAVSLLKPAYAGFGTDYWVFREDLYVLAKALEETSNGAFKFNIKRAGDINLSDFIEGLDATYKKIQAGGL